MQRTEFGQERSQCDCKNCATNCKFMPGFLIPSDLTRMHPGTDGIFEWAAKNLLASPGALVMRDGEAFRIPTLVPATKQDGSCINLTADNLCSIHPVAPFGCAFFDCNSSEGGISRNGLQEIMRAWASGEIYAQIWMHLHRLGKIQISATILRERMMQHMDAERLSQKG